MCTLVTSVDKHLSRLRSPRVSEGIMVEQRVQSMSVGGAIKTAQDVFRKV